MFRNCAAAIILSGFAAFAQSPTDLTGTWGFTHADDRFQGWVVLSRSGDTFRGAWHTSKGKTEPDDDVTARIDGDTVTLWRFIGNNKQSFVLTLSADGTRLDGYGDGYFLNHTNLSMQRNLVTTPAPATPSSTTTTAPKAQRTSAVDLSGLWTFTHFNNRFQGTVTLTQNGNEVSGIWHTSKGKTEPDDTVTGRIERNTLTLWRFIGNEQQYFVLNLSADRSRLDGFGDGYFLNHTNLNMARVVEPAVSSAPIRK